MITKSLFKSRTFWANVFIIIVALFKHFGIDGDGATVDEGTLMAILGVVNIGLRLATSQGVHVVDPRP